MQILLAYYLSIGLFLAIIFVYCQPFVNRQNVNSSIILQKGNSAMFNMSKIRRLICFPWLSKFRMLNAYEDEATSSPGRFIMDDVHLNDTESMNNNSFNLDNRSMSITDIIPFYKNLNLNFNLQNNLISSSSAYGLDDIGDLARNENTDTNITTDNYKNFTVNEGWPNIWNIWGMNDPCKNNYTHGVSSACTEVAKDVLAGLTSHTIFSFFNSSEFLDFIYLNSPSLDATLGLNIIDKIAQNALTANEKDEIIDFGRIIEYRMGNITYYASERQQVAEGINILRQWAKEIFEFKNNSALYAMKGKPIDIYDSFHDAALGVANIFTNMTSNVTTARDEFFQDFLQKEDAFLKITEAPLNALLALTDVGSIEKMLTPIMEPAVITVSPLKRQVVALRLYRFIWLPVVATCLLNPICCKFPEYCPPNDATKLLRSRIQQIWEAVSSDARIEAIDPYQTYVATYGI